ncbi:MAG: hypothetical protein PHW36_00740 [Bacilli bacterium]|nr:hypothetical protein [Bacilli bacterium]
MTPLSEEEPSVFVISGQLLADIIKVAYVCTWEARVIVSPEGSWDLRPRSSDGAQNASIQIVPEDFIRLEKLPKEITEYPLNITVLESLKDQLETEPEVKITLGQNSTELTTHGGVIYTFKDNPIASIKPNSQLKWRWPDKVVTIPTHIVKDIYKMLNGLLDLPIYSSYFVLRFEWDTLSIGYILEDTLSFAIKCSIPVDMPEGRKVDVKMDNELMMNIFEAFKEKPFVNIYLKTNYPMIVEYQTENGSSLKIFQAPRLTPEEVEEYEVES